MAIRLIMNITIMASNTLQYRSDEQYLVKSTTPPIIAFSLPDMSAFAFFFNKMYLLLNMNTNQKNIFDEGLEEVLHMIVEVETNEFGADGRTIVSSCRSARSASTCPSNTVLITRVCHTRAIRVDTAESKKHFPLARQHCVISVWLPTEVSTVEPRLPKSGRITSACVITLVYFRTETNLIFSIAKRTEFCGLAGKSS